LECLAVQEFALHRMCWSLVTRQNQFCSGKKIGMTKKREGIITIFKYGLAEASMSRCPWSTLLSLHRICCIEIEKKHFIISKKQIWRYKTTFNDQKSACYLLSNHLKGKFVHFYHFCCLPLLLIRATGG